MPESQCTLLDGDGARGRRSIPMRKTTRISMLRSALDDVDQVSWCAWIKEVTEDWGKLGC